MGTLFRKGKNMKTKSSIARAANPKTLAGRFRTACAVRLLPLLLMALPAVVQAQDYTYTTNNDGSLNIYQFTGAGGDVIIPDTIDGLPVTSIGDDAFYYCPRLISITIPNSVTSIGSEAFYDGWSLTNVIIGFGVTNVGDYAFGFCTNLMSVYFGGNAPSWGSSVFNGNYHVNVYYPPGAKGWPGYPSNWWLPPVPYIYYTTNNSTIVITEYLGNNAAVAIPSTINGLPVTSIGDNAFSNCYHLTSITIPDGITNIGNFVFCRCSSLTNVTIPNSVTSIGEGAFYRCSGLPNITIPNNVTSIGAIRSLTAPA
jgi:hypothetical protein